MLLKEELPEEPRNCRSNHEAAGRGIARRTRKLSEAQGLLPTSERSCCNKFSRRHPDSRNCWTAEIRQKKLLLPSLLVPLLNQ